VQVPSDDEAATLHEVAADYLAAAGFEHYEVSNYARRATGGASFRCRHNLVYWSDEPYLGFGAGAHSYFGGRRFWNETDPQRYVEMVLAGQSGEAGYEQIDALRGAQDRLMMGLRVSDGVDLDEVAARYGVAVDELCGNEIEELASMGLVARQGRRLALTRRGRLLANDVLLRLLPRLQAV
jgi:oxygen-independent coproporphyrinogen-3 oxidase